jgi:hypothetical protein
MMFLTTDVKTIGNIVLWFIISGVVNASLQRKNLGKNTNNAKSEVR